MQNSKLNFTAIQYILSYTYFEIRSSEILVVILAVLVGLLFVKEIVEAVELFLLSAVNIVPPVTHKVLLVKYCPVWTEKSRPPPVLLAHVENLNM